MLSTIFTLKYLLKKNQKMIVTKGQKKKLVVEKGKEWVAIPNLTIISNMLILKTNKNNKKIIII